MLDDAVFHILDEFLKWSQPQSIRLHAGELKSSEVRLIQSVIRSIRYNLERERVLPEGSERYAGRKA